MTAFLLKVQETEEKLKYFLLEGEHQEQVMQRRTSTLKRRRDDVNKSADNAVHQINDQLKLIEAELSKVCEDQKAKMKGSQQDQLSELQDEARNTGSILGIRQEIYCLSVKLLRILIFKPPEKTSSRMQSAFLKKLRYRELLCRETFSPEDLRWFLQDNLLGYFESKDNSPKTAFRNQSNISQTSYRTSNTVSGTRPSVKEEKHSVTELQSNLQPGTTAILWTVDKN